VGDVDDGDVVPGEVADHLEEALDLLVVQDGRGLVHDDHLGVLGQRPGHADHLLGRRRQRRDLGRGADLGVAEAGEQLARGPGRGGGAGDAEPRALAAEEDVVGDGESRDEVEFLVDRRDAQRHRRLRIAEVHLLPAPADRARVGLVRPGEHLDQRGLARAVLTEQAVHLTGADVEVHAVQSADARELLDDAVHLEQRSRHGASRLTFAQR
jgi:hypothetical protein